MEKFKVGDRVILTNVDRESLERGFNNGDVLVVAETDSTFFLDKKNDYWFCNNEAELVEHETKELTEYYKSLFEAGVSELKAEKLNVDYLLSVLDEIQEISSEGIVKSVIENAINRHNLDKAIHAKKLFNK